MERVSLVYSPSFYIIGYRLADFYVGATNTVPRDQQLMAPEEFNLKECKFYEGLVPDDATVRIDCPPGEVTGRYLVVQLSEVNHLTLCEVTAAEAATETG